MNTLSGGLRLQVTKSQPEGIVSLSLDEIPLFMPAFSGSVSVLVLASVSAHNCGGA